VEPSHGRVRQRRRRRHDEDEAKDDFYGGRSPAPGLECRDARQYRQHTYDDATPHRSAVHLGAAR
jgi:hypothetical protein